MKTLDASAAIVMERCDILARYSEEPDRLTRRFATQAMRQANAAVAGWMRDAGMSVQYDAIGNLIGRYEGDTGKTLLLGSHLDTVRDAGRYDGILGVLSALACVDRLHERAARLPYSLEVLAFADEEGLRYHSAYVGSRAMTGTFDSDILRFRDVDGITMAEAIQAHGGNPDPPILSTPRWRREELLGYCEVHIEQGPILEARNLPVGVVSAITGNNRIALSFVGEAGHAGTVPMALRRDAFCAAAEFALTVETLARKQPGLVATIGQVSVQPGASNVIPGQVALSLDVRHQEDAVRVQAREQLHELARTICARRNIALDWHSVQESPTIPCAPPLVQRLEQAIEAEGYHVLALPSGAGHDAAVLSELTAIAMLFVRCRGGISHNPAESVKQEDVTVALAVMERFLTSLPEMRGR
jgi:allantoate deiminase